MAEEINEFEKDVQQWQRKRKRAKNPSLAFKGAGGEMELGGSVMDVGAGQRERNNPSVAPDDK